MSQNTDLFERAKKVIPGGVNSPVRAFGAVGGEPPFISKAIGPFLWDSEGKCFTDYVGSWGAAIVGHAHPEVVSAVQQAVEKGLSYGAPTESEVLLAEQLVHLLPSIEQVRLVSSGTEATMSAIRLARGFTERSIIVKFAGCYHGHSDSLLVKAGSGLLTFGLPSSAGIPDEISRHTLVLDYNNVEQLEETFAKYGNHIACVIIEPYAGNMNLVRPTERFITSVRYLTDKYGALLIYDEVMTGFRVALNGAQGLQGITPDLTTLGKVIGGGLPLAAFGGRADVMKKIAPLGNVYQAGTLSGNPVAVAAGLATLRIIQQPGFYQSLTERTSQLVKGLNTAARDAGQKLLADSVGGMFGIYFSEHIPKTYAEVEATELKQFKQFFHRMLSEGIFLAPSAYEAGFVSIAHTSEVIENTISAARRALVNL